MDGFNTFEKQDKVLLGLNSGADAAAAYRILQQQGFAVLTFTAEDTADSPAAPATLLPLLAEQAAKLDCAFIATGHYARIEVDEGGVSHIITAVDAEADQSAILAVFAVHDGSADVDVDQLGLAVLQQPDAVVGAVGAEDAGGAVGTLLPAAVGHGLGRGTTGQPAALLGDAHGEHLVSIGTGGLCQGTQPGRGRNTADLVLTGYAAEKQRNAQLFSFVHSRKTPQQLYTDTLQVFSLL